VRLAHVVEARQQQNQRIDPRQILASEILAWTSPELDAAVERELAENPALEAHDSGGAGLSYSAGSSEDRAGVSDRDSAAAMLSPGAGACEPLAAPSFSADMASSALLRAAPSAESSLPISATGPWGGGLVGSDDGIDPLERVAAHMSLRDHLRGQVGQATSDARRARLVRYLIECVDERGWLLAGDLADVAAAFEVPCSEAEAAVAALQTMDPPGVGARDLRECLLLQSEYLEQSGEGQPLLRRILLHCWEDLAGRREQRIASRLRVSAADVREALRFLQTALTPYPGAAFRSDGMSRRGGGAAVRPDILFLRTEAGFSVELTRDYDAVLTVAPLWQRLADKPEAAADEGMRRYIRDHVERAQRFLSGVSRRGQTLRRIANALTELQPGFLETGNRAFLRPLTRQALAESLELDESVVSRAVADKWAQLPAGEVVALDAFFGNAHAVRDALAALIAGEDPANPYSDDEIADILCAQGFPLARRTVAKYRNLEKILPARLRKRAGGAPAANPVLTVNSSVTVTVSASSTAAAA
jgi:RNA polymerase sigma-54 factor